MDGIVTKCCKQCNNEFPATQEYFNIRKDHRDGLQTKCKQCEHEAYLQRKNRPKVAPPNELVCIGCGISKPATQDFFGKDSKSPHGLYTKCKECVNAYNRQNRLDDPESAAKQRVRVRRWRALNPERNAILRKRLRSKEHYRNHEKEYAKRHQRMMRRHYTEKHRQYRTTVKYRQYLERRKHCEEYRLKSRIYEHNKRVRFYSAPGKYTKQDIQKKLLTQKNRCYYCNKQLTKYHVDHVVPLSRDGSNYPDNLVLACPTCNMRKNNKLPHEWPEGGRLL